MFAEMLADSGNWAQNPHPIFGVPSGLVLLVLIAVLLLRQTLSRSSSKGSSSENFDRPKQIIDVSDYGEHRFSKGGYCLKCGYERGFLVKGIHWNCKDLKIEEIVGTPPVNKTPVKYTSRKEQFLANWRIVENEANKAKINKKS